MFKPFNLCIIQHTKGFGGIVHYRIHAYRRQAVIDSARFFPKLSFDRGKNIFAVFSVTAGNFVCAALSVFSENPTAVITQDYHSKF